MPSITGTWDSQSIVWGEANAALIRKYPLFSVGAAFYRGESGVNFVGSTPVPVILERTGLTITGRNNKGEYKSDPSVKKKMGGIWPIIVGSPGDTIQIYGGAHDTPGGAVRWEGPRTFTIGTSEFLDFDSVAGPYLAVKFESSGMRTWRLLGYDLDIEVIGEH
jgi:hypothetical protein